uniref:antirestriction protein n=1 Tax=Cupriavidus gilardii TaxID=82541 RepID=UPI002478C12A|nr:antirestriction protein [Cupriavidus gilardii]WDE72679.1 hypothetical protein [Cupriavidus gilardii]
MSTSNTQQTNSALRAPNSLQETTAENRTAEQLTDGLPESHMTGCQITKMLVADDQRMAFLPRHVGMIGLLVVENAVYSQLRQLTADYGGGFWDYYDLSNGGFFMAPSGGDSMRLSNPMNYSDETMSAEAAGIVACMYVFGNLSFDPRFRRLADKYHLLREFSLEHAEAAKIFSLID